MKQSPTLLDLLYRYVRESKAFDIVQPISSESTSRLPAEVLVGRDRQAVHLLGYATQTSLTKALMQYCSDRERELQSLVDCDAAGRIGAWRRRTLCHPSVGKDAEFCLAAKHAAVPDHVWSFLGTQIDPPPLPWPVPPSFGQSSSRVKQTESCFRGFKTRLTA